jgi:hypothetical protein
LREVWGEYDRIWNNLTIWNGKICAL